MELAPWVFGAFFAAGLTFLLFSIFFGEAADLSDAGAALSGDAAELQNLGCTAISAFLVGFGSLGLLGTLAGWNLIVSILGGIAMGLLFGRITRTVMRFVLRQQSSDLLTTESLIGTQARITVDTPAGQTGEALVEGDSFIKYAVRAANDEIALKKGDYVEIVNVENGRIYVKKKRTGAED